MTALAAGSRAARCPLWLVRLFPFIRWWYRVDGRTARDDVIAGLTGAVVVLPQGVAFATIAGMPPEYGLYAGMVPAIIAALFGSSWHLVSGPTTAASIVLFSSLSQFAEPASAQYVQLALTLTFMVGLLQLVMGMARLGTLVNFISHSVVLGFTAGAAVLIAANQIKHFFGIDIPRGAEFFETLHELIRHVGDIQPYVLAVSAATLVSGIALKRFLPRFPYMIGALAVGSAAAALINGAGSEVVVPTVGALPSSLPPLSAPNFSLETIKQLAPAALAVTLFALTEAVSIARSLALRSGQHLDGNQEFIGQGLSNVAGSFFSGYVATGSFNRSGLNYEAGAKTPLAAVLAGLLLMVVVLLVAPWADYLPNAAMAAVLFMVAWGLVDFHHIRQVIRVSRSETVVMAATFFAALFLGLEFAIFLGVSLSLGLYLSRTSRPTVRVRVPDPRLPKRRFTTDSALPECPQLRFLRIDGSLFYGAVAHVADQLHQLDEQPNAPRNVALVASGINFIDIAGAELLVQEAKRLQRAGGRLYLLRPNRKVLDLLEKGGYVDAIGRENVFNSKGDGIATAFSRLDHTFCATCPRRIFSECETVARGEKAA